MTNSVKPPIWFWVVSVIALLWNLMGVMAYVGEAFATQEMLESMPENQRLAIANRPAWATGAFALAVWGGALGSLMLLLRQKLSEIVLIISLAGILVQMTYNLFLSGDLSVYGPAEISMAILIPIIGFLLILVARRSKREGWLK